MKELIEALTIMLKYGNPNYPTHCEHDEMTISNDIDWNKITKEDQKKLDELGFSYSEELECIASFRYGSC